VCCVLKAVHCNILYCYNRVFVIREFEESLELNHKQSSNNMQGVESVQPAHLNEEKLHLLRLRELRVSFSLLFLFSFPRQVNWHVLGEK